MDRYVARGVLAGSILFGFVSVSHAGVGRTPGYADATQGGDAVYSIPLKLPPGSHGLTPQLSLTYSSAVGQSDAGIGWFVSGASVISRCPQTVAQDGAARGIRLDLNDRFCLDGNRLRLASGTYGVAGSTYRTEIETYGRITANSTAGNGPASFKVEGRDGLTYEYGNTGDSRIESIGSTTARAWALNRIADRQGNEVLFTYSEDPTNGGFRLDLVTYTGNASVVAPYAVDFIYETKPAGDIDSGYVAGGLVKQITRLDRVDVKASSGDTIRSYDLSYEPSLSASGHSRLASVQECAGSPIDCLSPTTFSWQSGSVGLGAEVVSPATVPVGTGLPLDVNGDGRVDLVYPSTTGSGGKWMVMFANASGGYNTPVNTGIANTNYAGAITIDYNADGKGDLLVPYSGTTWWVMLGTSSGLATPTNTNAPVTTTGKGDNARAIDIDGDGLQDLVWADLVGWNGGDAIRYRLKVAGGAFSATVQTLVGPLNVDEQLVGPVFAHWSQNMGGKAPDFNGDGRGDIAVIHGYYRDPICCGTNGPTPLAAGPAAPTLPPVYYIDVIAPGIGTYQTVNVGSGSDVYFGDFNGDGKTDLLYKNNATVWHYRYSTGTTFTAVQSGPSTTDYAQGWVIDDWDGDGYDDALAPNVASGTWHVMRSTGESFATPISTGLPLSVYDSMAVLDANGDGLMDLAYGSSTGSYRYRLHSLDTSLPDLLSSATDGFGTTATYTYLPITNSTVYTKGTGAVFPQVDLQIGRWVVRQIAQTDLSGSDTTASQTFTYETARKDLQGRGFLGFAKRTVTDGTLGYNVKTIQTFQQTFPYIGTLSSVEVQQSSGTRIALTTNTWASLTYGTGFAARSFPYVKTSTTDEYEAGGTYNGTKVRTTSTAVASTGGIDSTSGLITDATTTTTEVATGLNAGSAKTERVQHTSVFNDTVNWCIGRPSATQQTSSHTLGSGAAVTRSSDVTWDGVSCRPTQARLEPGNATLEARLDLGYDPFGNVTSQTVTGAGMTGRSTTTTWDANGRFPVSVTNAAGETTQLGWDPRTGLQTSQLDPNGFTTSWIYDAHGRRTSETRPGGASTLWTYATCPLGCDSRVKYIVQQDERDAGLVTVRSDTSYFNRWDALAWQKTQLLTARDTAWTVRREFDARGRVSRDYVPYLTSGSDSGYRSISYDLLDRVVSESLYTASGVLDRTTSYGYSGLQVGRTDPLGHTTTRTSTAWGEMIQLTDAAGGQVKYQFDAFGLFKRATDAANNVVSTVAYNVRGFRTGLTDMDLGAWTFTPNALGEVVSQTDAKGQTTTFVYDPLGRLKTRTEPDGTANWTWGNSAAAHNVGQLASMSGPGYSESYTYDQWGRLSNRRIVSDATYDFDLTYNALGAPDTLTYPTSTGGVRIKVKYAYTGGVLTSVQDYTGNVNGTVYWFLNLLDASGHAVSETYGNGLWLQNAFDPLTGDAKTRQAGTGGQATNIQNLAYAWDKAGNLSSRQDVRQGIGETFTYDALDRLTLASGPGAQSLSVTYDAIGNVTSRSDIAGTFTYDATRRHAVTAAGTNSYGYDANGNMTTRNGATILWNSANLPTSLNVSGFNAFFAYAPDRSRWRQVSGYSGGSETTTYVGGLMEILTTNVRTNWKHRIFTPSGEVQVIRRNDGTSDVYYMTTDHLGSTDTVTDASAAVLVRESFGAWGARRSSNWQGSPPPSEWQQIANTTRRGYTGHEQIDNVLLVHMNGRVYDPAIGRFLAADPYIDGAESSQGWNRYAYVHNRPIVRIDPTGYYEIGEGMNWKVVAVNPGQEPAGTEKLEEVITIGRIWQQIWSGVADDLRRLKLSTNVELGTHEGGGGGGGGRGTPTQPKKDKAPCDSKASDDADVGLSGLSALATAADGAKDSGLVDNPASAVAKQAESVGTATAGRLAPGAVASAANWGRNLRIITGASFLYTGYDLVRDRSNPTALAYDAADILIGAMLVTYAGPGVGLTAAFAYSAYGGTEQAVADAKKLLGMCTPD